MNIVDEIPEPHRSAFITVLERQNPELLTTLRTNSLPTRDQWEMVEDAFNDAMVSHYGPGHEPDEIGKEIDNALGAFMLRWPNDNLA